MTLDDDTVLFITLKGGSTRTGCCPTTGCFGTRRTAPRPSKKGAEVLEAMRTGRCLHAFCLPGKGEFVYCCMVVPLEHEGEKPIRITYRLLTPLTSELQQGLEAWGSDCLEPR